MGLMALGLGFKMFCIEFSEYHNSSAILQFGLMKLLYVCMLSGSNYSGLCVLFSGYANTALGIAFPQNDGMDLALCHSCDQVFDCTVLSITSLFVFWTLVSGLVSFLFYSLLLVSFFGCV